MRKPIPVGVYLAKQVTGALYIITQGPYTGRLIVLETIGDNHE